MKNQIIEKVAKFFSLSLLIAVTTACSNTIELSKALPNDPDFAPIMPEEEEERIVPSGSLFKPNYVNNIYSDSKAHRVGDIISVILSEKTQANKNAKTELKKENETNLDAVTGFGGVPVSINGESLSFGLSQDSNFKGDSKADQGNSLNGNISVHVLKVLANGNLMIRGEKWLTLNNGDEYIRLTGIIRSKDINSNNTILSTKVANARIQYSGTGSFADANEQGWLVKFFNSTWWPF
ncbi:flagellar basal body L-ring protein FlgH [Colwellia sp. E2M01]|uniref:flagellar basal body L-ring protein FlgH n=1 Tax=Colwellia sp. E2M01 TaxID=2841561 RepID=UPI001C0A5ADF|nr:flagellar basal body L-ring protein FlgH [Colwellia sp. E2M01]MBU2869984.1 flagellar basal body L-ring protein FlgH [Colwellia sp. E2M01]